MPSERKTRKAGCPDEARNSTTFQAGGAELVDVAMSVDEKDWVEEAVGVELEYVG
jgi:hypothetical protein